MRDSLTARIAAQNLTNVMVLPLQETQHYHQMLVDADLSLITQQRGSGACFFPSKLLSYLAFSKPVLVVADEQSELAMALKQGGFGTIVPPEDPSRLAQSVESLAANPILRRDFGEAGCRFVKQFEFKTVLARFERDLMDLVGAGSSLHKPAGLGSRETVAAEPSGV